MHQKVSVWLEGYMMFRKKEEFVEKGVD